MLRGPKGEKRPADVIVNAVHVMRIATGEIKETTPQKQHKRLKGLSPIMLHDRKPARATAALTPLNLISGLLHAVQLGQVGRHPSPTTAAQPQKPK